jgi:fructokinase
LNYNGRDMSGQPVVAGLGELLWDLLPTGRQPGGAPCNFAYHAQQAGCESSMVSAIGKDSLGDELLQTIGKLGLSSRYIQRNDYPTGTVTVAVDESGHPAYTIHERVAWDYIQWTEEAPGLAARLDAVCFGSLAQRNSTTQQFITQFLSSLQPGCLKVFDINLRQHYFSSNIIENSLRLADVLKLNEDELSVVCSYLGIEGDLDSRLNQLLSQASLKYVVYTMGSNGSIITGIGEYSVAGAPKVSVADSVGAGDAFTAVFIAGMLRGNPLKETHIKASEVAAYVCTKQGATPRTDHFFNDT